MFIQGLLKVEGEMGRNMAPVGAAIGRFASCSLLESTKKGYRACGLLPEADMRFTEKVGGGREKN